MDPHLEWIASATGASTVRRGQRIQSLWSGYGEIFRVSLVGSPLSTAIVKWVKPPAGGGETLSRARKCRSYDVEMAWYRGFAPRCDTSSRVPELIGSEVSGGEWRFLLEDLDHAGFNVRKHRLEAGDIEACLRWLAAFHARFMGVEPAGLWQTGTYWHLATRPDELLAIEDGALRDAAPILDGLLARARHKTFVHGDAKVANFCFAPGGRGVAAVDFQYVGGGVGVKDVAYFLGSCSRRGAEIAEERYLDAYFGHLASELGRRENLTFDASEIEREWRALYPIAIADFGRFVAGWAPSEWEHDEHGQRITRRVLATLGRAASARAGC